MISTYLPALVVPNVPALKKLGVPQRIIAPFGNHIAILLNRLTAIFSLISGRRK